MGMVFVKEVNHVTVGLVRSAVDLCCVTNVRTFCLLVPHSSQECTDPCCDARTCQLAVGAQCDDGECCSNLSLHYWWICMPGIKTVM